MNELTPAPIPTLRKRRGKKFLGLLIALFLLGAVPLILYVAQNRATLRSGAADSPEYKVFCAEAAETQLLNVSDPTEVYDEATGTYTMQWVVQNMTDQPITLHTEELACRCKDPNAQATPASLLADSQSSYPGRLCISDIVRQGGLSAPNPLTEDAVRDAWKYCEYGFSASPEKLSSDSGVRAEKEQRAQITTGKKNGAITIAPRQEAPVEIVVRTPAEVTGAKHCGSFQAFWSIAAIDGCSSVLLTDKQTGTRGVLITGDGQVDGRNYADWRPEGVGTIGATCELSTTPPAQSHCVGKSCASGAGTQVCSDASSCTSYCGAMDASFSEGNGGASECLQVVSSYYWNGSACVAGATNSCMTCSGTDCDHVFETEEACTAAFSHCEAPTGEFKACVNKSCQVQAGLTRDLCTQDSDCFKSVCVGNNRCEQTAIADLREGDITCTGNAECNVRMVCQGAACVAMRGDARNGEVSCTKETEGSVCKPLATYRICENNACVEKTGTNKQSTCTTINDCSHLTCDANKQCTRVSGPGADSCQNSSQCGPTGGPKHRECNTTTKQCVEVDGIGADTCTDNLHCQTPTHLACNAQKQCVSVEGPGQNTCTNAAHCQNPTHRECRQNTCAIVDGAGADRCTDNRHCEQPTHKECVQLSCQTVQGAGADACTDNAHCQPVKHRVCNANQCLLIDGPGRDECTDNRQCEPETHSECVGRTCTEIQGAGVDRCSSNAHCEAPTHAECVNDACVTVQGPGQNRCSDNAQCTTPEHRECVGNSCQILQGYGRDQCISPADCTAQTHRECTSAQTCTEVQGAGQHECNSSTDCAAPTHRECVNRSCATVTGGGLDRCTTNTDCSPATHRTCVGRTCTTVNGAGTDTCTSDAECESITTQPPRSEPPVGQPQPPTALIPPSTDGIASYRTCRNNMCIRLAGIAPSGTALCTSHLECAPRTQEGTAPVIITVPPTTAPPSTPAPLAEGTYRACLQHSCVVLSGTPPSGTPLCSVDADCTGAQAGTAAVPTTGTNHLALITGILTLFLLLLGLRTAW